ncbi:MAG: hypothetical protein J6S49_05355 [Erysipelotrichaceae bacterium]|nr:hypothetical protein [Erysipelotrichaceae bacterium]
MRKGRIIMITLLVTMMSFGFFGCQKEEPISGGTTDKTDYNAPKEIKSKDISELSTHFYLDLRYTANDDHLFDFEIKKDDSGTLMATENNSGISFKADKKLLDDLQAVIDKYELVKDNGVNKVTAGLPPEFQPCYLKVDYASGEQLYFRYDNDPSAKWATRFYDIFARWFADNGDDSLYPEKESSLVERIDIRVVEGDMYYECSGVNVQDDQAIDGEKYLLNRSIFDDSKKEVVYDRFIRFPEDYYQNITEILNRYDTVMKYDFSYFDHDSGFYGFNDDFYENEEDGDVSWDIYIKYESGKILNIETSKASEIEAMSGLLNDLRTYCDSLFE